MALTLEERLMIEYLRRQGYSIPRISRELGISRITVKRYLENPQKGKYCRLEPYISKLNSYKEYIKSRLKDYPDITAEKLYREIKEKGFEGSYRAVAYYVDKNRPVKEQEVFLRYETEPGEQAQVDCSEFGRINYYARECKFYCFSFVWGYSRRHYIEFTVSEDIHTLMSCHTRAFEYFGGVPKKILYDNMRKVVKSNIGSKVDYNEKFMDFALYYGFLLCACDVAQGYQKGKIERVIEYIRTSFFTGEKLSSLEELNSKALYWCSEIADKRIHGTTHERPIDRWQEEKKLILSLPQIGYDTRKTKHRVVQKDCYLNWQGNCYSVPWQYARKTVVVKGSEEVLHIYYDDKCIAQHRVSRQKGKYIRNPEHLKGIPLVKDSRKQRYREELAIFGEVGLKYFEELLRSSISNPCYHLNVVVKLKQSYPVSEITKSIEVALKFKALKGKTIVNLLRRQIPAQGLNRLEEILSIPGLDYNLQEVEERPLEFYDWVVGDKR